MSSPTTPPSDARGMAEEHRGNQGDPSGAAWTSVPAGARLIARSPTEAVRAGAAAAPACSAAAKVATTTSPSTSCRSNTTATSSRPGSTRSRCARPWRPAGGSEPAPPSRPQPWRARHDERQPDGAPGSGRADGGATRHDAARLRRVNDLRVSPPRPPTTVAVVSESQATSPSAVGWPPSGCGVWRAPTSCASGDEPLPVPVRPLAHARRGPCEWGARTRHRDRR